MIFLPVALQENDELPRGLFCGNRERTLGLFLNVREKHFESFYLKLNPNYKKSCRVCAFLLP